MAKALIIYATKQGQTQKIAQFMAERLAKLGFQVNLFNSDLLPHAVLPEFPDFTIIGASVHMHDFPQNLKKWIKANSAYLARQPTYFFSVCLGVLQKDEKVQKDEARIVKKLFLETHWTPAQWTIFAGALPYSKYNWFLKRIMRRIAKKAGIRTNIKNDYEYTEWKKVESFTRNVVASLGNEIIFGKNN